MKIAENARLKKLIVVVAQSAARKMGECAIKRAPPITAASAGRATGGWVGAMRVKQAAETRNDAASPIRATGADRSCTSNPPRLGPPTNENALVPERTALPST